MLSPNCPAALSPHKYKDPESGYAGVGVGAGASPLDVCNARVKLAPAAALTQVSPDSDATFCGYIEFVPEVSLLS